MTFSIQIPSPKFLDDSFTTQMDLITGKVFYHSKLGEFIASLPYQVADEIQRSVWRYIFSNKVLAIRKPLYFDWDDNTICHQDINQYIEGHIEYVKENLGGKDTYGLKLIDRKYAQIRNEQLNFSELTGDAWRQKDTEITEQRYLEKKAMKESRYETLRNLNHSNILQSDTEHGFSHPSRLKMIHGETTLEDDCEVIKSMIICNTSIPFHRKKNMYVSHIIGKHFVSKNPVCQCMSKTGCMCGGSTENKQYDSRIRFIIPEELNEKYEPLCGYVGIVKTCTYEIKPQPVRTCALLMCIRHQKEWIKDLDGAVRRWGRCGSELDIDDGGEWSDTELINKFERKLDLYLEQHNYHYKHGCWTKGDPREGYTYDTTRKKPKKIPYEQRTVNMWCIEGWHVKKPADYYYEFGTRDEGIDIKAKTIYLPKFSKTLDNNYQDHRNPNIEYCEW